MTNAMPNPPTDWVPAKQAAGAVGVNERTMRRGLNAGSIPGKRVGGRLWFVPRWYIDSAKKVERERHTTVHVGTYRTPDV